MWGQGNVWTPRIPPMSRNKLSDKMRGNCVPHTSEPKPDISTLGLLGYFDQQVLAAYRNEPHKYSITSDYFEGSLSVTNEYFLELEAAGKADQSVSISFGYRT
jgi:hypothetical protein